MKKSFEELVYLITNIECRIDYDYARGYLAACKEFLVITDNEYDLLKKHLVDIAKIKGIRKITK